MNVELHKSELQRFVRHQVSSGNFPSAEAVVEASLTRMMEEEISLTDEDLHEIELSQQQFDCGETVEFGEFASRMRRKFGIA